MRSPNPSSFKNFSAQKRKPRKGGLWVGLFFIAGLGGIGFLVWDNHQGPLPLQKEKKGSISSSGIEKEPKEESYIDFEKTEETGAAHDLEEEEDRSIPASDSELVQIFKAQEKYNLPPFPESEGWKKNAQKRVLVPKGKAEVAIVLDKTETFSPKDWEEIYKLNIPLTFIFLVSHPEAPQMAQKAWSKGREIVVKGHNKGERLEKRFPRMLGIVEERRSSSLPNYLTLSRSKGLKEGLPHRIFFFPLVREKKAFTKSKRSIMWIIPKGERLPALSRWIQQQKKKVAFIPLSQLYRNEQALQQGKVIDAKKIKAGRINLV